MKRFIKEYVLENWSLKATAVLLSLIIWLFVRGEPGPERVVSVPLEVQVPRQMEITHERPTSVEVTMRGAAFSSMWFSQPLPTCVVDLQRANEGEHVITLTPENVKTSKGSGIEVLQVNPARVTLVLEQTVSKEVPIVVPVRGEPASGFDVYGRFSKPPTIVITGPRSRIEPVREIPAEAVSISGQKQPVRFFVALNIKDNAIRTPLNNPVQVDIQIGPRRKLFTVAQVPVVTDDPTYMISPKQIAVQVLAPADSAAELAPADFRAFVSTKNLNAAPPVKTKPQVGIVNNKLSGDVIIKDVYPSEVVIRRSGKK
jgi:hypothetical protein